MSKLKEAQRLEIESRLQVGQSKRSIARDLGVSFYQVNKTEKALSSAESGESVLQDALRLPESDLETHVHTGTPADKAAEVATGPAIETVENPDTGAKVNFMRVTAEDVAEQEQPTEYLVSPQPILPSKQAGTEKFDSRAMEDVPEVAEAMYHPPVALPTRHTESGRLYIRRRVRWHGENFEKLDFQLSGELLTGEQGIEQARELPGWHEQTKTYVMQFHPDTPEHLLSGEPDWLEPHGKLPSGFEYSPARGVVIRRHKTLSPEELEQKRFFRQQARVIESLG